MKITLPAKVTGTRDALFVLEVEFPVATGERTVEVEVQGPVEPLDLAGSSRGGTYRIPVGLERLHVPMRVTADGEAQATVGVRCSSGPDKGESESGTVVLEAAQGSVARNFALRGEGFLGHARDLDFHDIGAAFLDALELGANILAEGRANLLPADAERIA